MTLLKTTSFSICIACCVACIDEKQGAELTTLHVTTDCRTEAINTADYFESARFVPLETRDDVLINIDAVDGIMQNRVMHRDKYFYLSDGETLFRFDEEGRFKGKISRKGEGPDEYTSLVDFDIDADGYPWILSREKLRQYDWNAEVKRTVNLESNGFRFHIVSSDKALLRKTKSLTVSGGDRSQLLAVSLQTGETLQGYVPLDSVKFQYLNIFGTTHFSPAVDGSAYYYDVYNDTVYHFDNETLVPAFCVDLYGRNIPASFFNEGYQDVMAFSMAVASNGYAYGTSEFIDGHNYCLYSYIAEDSRTAIISKETGLSVVDAGKISETLLLGGAEFEAGKLSDGDAAEAIALLDPFDILESVDPDRREAVSKVINYTNEDQNPGILVLKLR